MYSPPETLVVGEIILDYTVARNGEDCKLRLGGIAHAARGLWASNIPYSAAVFCPKYLVGEAKKFLVAHGCGDFYWLGDVVGAPNVIVIGDVTELSDQEYQDLLRETKEIQYQSPLPNLSAFKKAVVFPGKYDFEVLQGLLAPDAMIAVDVAYDVAELSALYPLREQIRAIIVSTSSPLFLRIGGDDFSAFIAEASRLSPDVILLKENRGGSRLFNLSDGTVEEIPASLGKTRNSVGVGDAYSAVMVGFSEKGWCEAAWRGSQVATAYSQTTYPDDLKRDVLRSFEVAVSKLQALGGTRLPWHDRQKFSIYVAGPDFSYTHKPEYDQAVSSLLYHNFRVRRPVLENGELERPAGRLDMSATFASDRQLLMECDLVVAIPLERDPGTLVEVGMAIELGKPVITFDPRQENDNTMVVGGSVVYSSNLDECLNGIFNAVAQMRSKI